MTEFPNSLNLFTNNPQAAEFFRQQVFPIKVQWVGTTALDVFMAAKSTIKAGGRLLSNPLTGVRTAQKQTQGMFPGHADGPVPFFDGRQAAEKSDAPAQNPNADQLQLEASEGLTDANDSDSGECTHSNTSDSKNTGGLRLTSGGKTGSKSFDANNQPPKITAINPFISVLVSWPLDTVDFSSMKQIDEAIHLYKKNTRLRFLAHSDQAMANFVAADLQAMVAQLASPATLPIFKEAAAPPKQ